MMGAAESVSVEARRIGGGSALVRIDMGSAWGGEPETVRMDGELATELVGKVMAELRRVGYGRLAVLREGECG